MTSIARDTYLETQVLTATPQKLRLMLIDGALRFARQTLEFWDDQTRRELRLNALARCYEIVNELYASIRTDSTPVVSKVKAVYRFLFGQLSLVSVSQDPQILQDVIEVLEVERETWRLVCEAMPEDPRSGHGVGRGAEEITAQGMPAIAPQLPFFPPASLPSAERFSLEA